MNTQEIAVRLTCSLLNGTQLPLNKETAAEIVNFYSLVEAELNNSRPTKTYSASFRTPH